MRGRFGKTGDRAAVVLEMRTGGVKGILGVALLAIVVVYSTIIFWPVAGGPALAIWAGSFGIVIISWIGAVAVMMRRGPEDPSVTGFWLKLVKATGVASNLLVALSIWLFLPPASGELHGLMVTFYIWYIVIQVMAETDASSVSESAIILVLGSLALYEFSHPAQYSVAVGGFALLFAASMLSFRRLIRRALMEALRARLETERANAGLDAALREVGAQRDAIRRFLAAASHDLQQPVQAASLYFDRAVGTPEAKSRTQAIEGARRAFASAQSLLRQMLEHLRLEAGVAAVRADAIPLGPLFAEVMLEHMARMEQAGIAVTIVPTRLAIAGDPELLRRILGNLLSNAATHSSASRLLLGARRRSGRVLLHIIDNGRGVSADAAHSIFDDFSSGSRGDGNFGLGLSTARRLAGAMGMGLRLSARWRGGACFVLDAPEAGGLDARQQLQASEDSECEAA